MNYTLFLVAALIFFNVALLILARQVRKLYEDQRRLKSFIIQTHKETAHLRRRVGNLEDELSHTILDQHPPTAPDQPIAPSKEQR